MSTRDSVSSELFARAQKSLPGGVNSPVRAFRSVGGDPIFVKSAKGATLVGADGREYVDYVGSWGPMILGHAHPEVIEAIQEAAALGTSYGAPTEGEIVMAETMREAYPNMEMSRMVSSGTEATMGALRVARGYTGRDVIVKYYCAAAGRSVQKRMATRRAHCVTFFRKIDGVARRKRLRGAANQGPGSSLE